MPKDDYKPSPTNCCVFYRCSNGMLIEMRCPATTVFDPELRVCNFPSQVSGRCGTKASTTMAPQPPSSTTPAHQPSSTTTHASEPSSTTQAPEVSSTTPMSSSSTTPMSSSSTTASSS